MIEDLPIFWFLSIMILFINKLVLILFLIISYINDDRKKRDWTPFGSQLEFLTRSKKIFKKAYDELLEKDFFGINEKDLSKLNLIDKINMHYKHVPNIPFEDNELEWWVAKDTYQLTIDEQVAIAGV